MLVAAVTAASIAIVMFIAKVMAMATVRSHLFIAHGRRDSHADLRVLPSLSLGNRIYNLYLVFGRFSAELGPETRSNGSGSKKWCRTHPKLAPETNSKVVS